MKNVAERWRNADSVCNRIPKRPPSHNMTVCRSLYKLSQFGKDCRKAHAKQVLVTGFHTRVTRCRSKDVAGNGWYVTYFRRCILLQFYPSNLGFEGWLRGCNHALTALRGSAKSGCSKREGLASWVLSSDGLPLMKRGYLYEILRYSKEITVL